MSRAFSAVVLAALLGAAGCASDPQRDTASASATPPASTSVSPSASAPVSPSASAPVSPSASAAPSSGNVILTEKDTGKTVTVHGNEVSVRLSHGWVWQEPRVLGGAVRLDQVNYLVDPGFTEWKVNPVRAGMSTVHIQGLPKQTGPGKNQGPLDVTYSFSVT